MGGGVLCTTPGSSTAGDNELYCIGGGGHISGPTTSADANIGDALNAVDYTNSKSSKGGRSSNTSNSNSNNLVEGETGDESQSNDDKSAGSVLEKANIFENLEKQQTKQTSQIPRAESIYGRKEEIYKSTTSSERDSGEFPNFKCYY